MTIKAEGRWAWWNQYMPQSMTVGRCIERAKEAKLDGVIVKATYQRIIQGFLDADIRVGVEMYCYPQSPISDASALVQGIEMGAEFAVINAEVEWEQPDSGEQMRQLCEKFRENSPAELYASVDTRGRRMLMPYQQVLYRYIVGWMPMIYPKAFYPGMHSGFIGSAFLDCLEKDFGGKPVLPTIQTYDSIGANNVQEQILQAKRFLGASDQPLSYFGYQAYTIGHATDAEWAVIVNNTPEEEENMPDWLDNTIVGLDGQPLVFNVLQADLSFKRELITYKRYLTLKVLGFLESDHSHMVKLV